MRERLSWHHVFIVARKEATDTLRDRRTWVAMVIVPMIIIPAVLLLAPTAVKTQMEKVEKSVARVAVVGGEDARSLLEFMGRAPGLAIEPSADPSAGLASRKLQAVLYLPAGFDGDVAAERQVSVRIDYDAADQRSLSAYERLMTIIDSYGKAIAERRLVDRHVDPAILRPVAAEGHNVAPPQKMGGFFLSMVMPMLIAMWAALGGMYAAIDATAGEKERGTLELLLSAPPSRVSLVVGKYLVVMAVSLASAAISVGAILVAFAIKPEAILGGMLAGGTGGVQATLPVGSLALIAVASVGIAAVFAALQLAVAVFARSFREAQTYLSPLTFLVLVPGIFTQFMPGVDAPAPVFWVPILNVIFVYKELIEGVVNWGHLGTMLLSSLVLARLCLRATVGLFRKEQVLFRV